MPLNPVSQIDYIIVSRHSTNFRGLFGEEITTPAATVHQSLADNDWEEFRRVYSDHFPVTTCVTVQADSD